MLRQRLVGGGTATKETQLRVDPRPGVWESVEVAVSFTGRSLLLSLGGEVTEEAMLAEAANPGTNAPSLRLGIVGTSGPGRIAIGYDDVLFLDK